MSLRFIFCMLLGLHISLATEDVTHIRLDKGWVRGIRHNVLGGTIVHEYLGIPMAKAPIANLRFRKPIAVDPWLSTFNATKRPNACWQTIDTAFPGFWGSEMWNPNTQMDEDCLYINAWVPNPDDTAKKSIMVWIYGGGFYSGSSALDVYDARYLAATQNVIVVSMNYRIGIFGFLQMSVPEAPGNMGLHDQVMGLKWVQENADYLNGDKDSVTIFGESAGSVSVSLHLLSPLSRNLFNRAIMQSGASTAKWAIMSLEDSWKRLERTFLDPARGFGCDRSSNTKKILECLRQLDARTIRNNEWITTGLIQFPWLPSVDYDFLLELPETTLMTRGFKKCPIMVGSNSNEGSFFLVYPYPFKKLYTAYNLTEIDFTMNSDTFKNEFIEEAFTYYPKWDTPLNRFGKEAIAHRYTDWRDPDDTIRNRYNLDMAVSDFHFLCPVNQFADYYVEAGMTVYSYLFAHRSSQNLWGKWTGVMHGDEIAYIFGAPLRPGSQYTDDEKALSRHMQRLWSNFSKTGHPNGISEIRYWNPAEPITKEYYELTIASMNNPRTGSGPRTEYCAFWDHYLPDLVDGTGDIADAEIAWKRSFYDWSNKYIVDWKHEYNTYLRAAHPTCDDGK